MQQELFEYENVANDENDGKKKQHDKRKNNKRYLMTALLFFGFINMHALRVNLNIALVEMTSNKTIAIDNQTIIQNAEFNWDSKTKGLLLSSFFFGFLFTPIGGTLSTKFGGVTMYGTGMLITSILTLLTPINLRLNFYWFLFCRFLEGIAEAISYTSTSDIWTHWAPPEDRSKLVSFSFSGKYIGISIAYPICGCLGYLYGWPSIFYGSGSAALIWYFIWILLAKNSPNSVHSLRRRSPRDKFSSPWKNMLRSAPLWALSVAKFAYGWGYAIIVQYFPIYIKDIMDIDTSKVGLLSAIPNFMSIFSIPLSGILIDLIINKNLLTPTRAHKFFISASLVSSGLLLLAVTRFTNIIVIMLCFTAFKSILSFVFVTIQVVPLYMAPRFSSELSGFTAFWYTMATIISSSFFGFIVTDHSALQWDACFIITSIMLIVSALIFIAFSSSELQPWAAPRSTNDVNDNHILNKRINK